jgi:hypothetical protein
MTVLKYSVQWDDPHGFGFWVRGIQSDGVYYGELQYAIGDEKRCAGTWIEGKLSEADWVRCQSHIAEMCHSTTNCPITWQGQLATWTTSISSPTIIFRYNTGDEARSRAASAFIGMKSLLLRAMHPMCETLMAFAKARHRGK